MYVVATAGHVDHGKSALVRRLTGMEPDRWAEELRRGMTIDLGFAWSQLPTGDDVAFVDVPGHERFITNMLAGIGAVPAVLLVIAADEGWMPQTQEHVDALDALGVAHGLVVVTKTDLADPQPAVDHARVQLASTTLRGVEAVTVSSVTGDGIDDVRSALSGLLCTLPAPDRTAPVRLWVDRAFTIRGAGTVVTGTLAAGTIRVGDRLANGTDIVIVRGLQSLGVQRDEVAATARVAVNLRGVDRNEVPRGTALVTPDGWQHVTHLDVRVVGDVPRAVLAHIGSAAVPARARRRGDGVVRLQLAKPLPLTPGDRLLLREPAARGISTAKVTDIDPPLAGRRGRVRAAATAPPRRALAVVDLDPITDLLDRLALDPFDAPDGEELRVLDRAALAYAARTGRLLDLGAGTYLGATATATAVKRLGKLEQPFKVSEAREALGSTRRVVVPLLEHLDAARLTRRFADGTRILVGREG